MYLSQATPQQTRHLASKTHPQRKLPLLAVHSIQPRILDYQIRSTEFSAKKTLSHSDREIRYMKGSSRLCLKKWWGEVEGHQPLHTLLLEGNKCQHGCLCLYERLAIPKAIKNAVLEDIHSRYPGIFAMLSVAQNIWWPYIHRDILAKTSEWESLQRYW